MRVCMHERDVAEFSVRDAATLSSGQIEKC